MAKFKLMQRVRIVRVERPVNKHLLNSETHITEVREENELRSRDCYGTANCPISVEGFSFSEDQLEPIIPEGASPSSWDKCVWKPDKELVHV